MFDIGFWELFVIFLLVLFVLGPERLPLIASNLGKWFGKIQRYFINLKDSIDDEVEQSDVNKIISDQKSHMSRMEEEIKKQTKKIKE
ncbi:MAG: twin-arginine translocase subunit TatB [Gammaproteobacteria bacterium]|nr:twin-arginine translocase subunit TatB [Gammaproteobacteria bacterium]MBH44768.1 twin-arginine translocase subunit TatB [Gammaproteobacteria bacterium]|tara:strand:+ start:359 stop:619 length:261 start_codon:yes stop_codon:yes gene_type:complete